MPNILTETLVPFQEVPEHVPTQNKRIHIATAYRWKQRGIAGIRLETVRIGGQVYTSLEALNRFFVATTEAADKSRRESRRAANLDRVRRAESELDAFGI